MSHPPHGGQPSYGGPPSYGQPSYGQAPPPPNRTPLYLALAVLVVVVVAGGVVAFVLLRDDQPQPVAATTSTSSSAPATSSEPARMTASAAMVTPTPRSTTPRTPRTTAAGTTTGLSDAETQLYLAAPDAYTDCAHLDPPADGALVAITCQVATSAGTATANFFGYQDVATAVDVYHADTDSLQPLAQDCYSGQGYTTYAQSNGQVAEVSCFVSPSGDAAIAWVDPITGVEGFLTLTGGGQAGLGPLSDWWVTDDANLPNT